jgi:hypothetical protein
VFESERGREGGREGEREREREREINGLDLEEEADPDTLTRVRLHAGMPHTRGVPTSRMWVPKP